MLQAKLPLLVEPEEDDPPEPGDEPTPIPDDRLRLVFTCCHPALAQEAQVALTLRLVCGVSTGDIAQAFLVSEPTMAARLTRAKKKIAAARIPYRVPRRDRAARAARRRPHRHPPPLHDGHTAPSGADLVRDDLADRALDLAPHAARPAARRARGPRAARPAARQPRPPCHAHRRRRPAAACWRTRTAGARTGRRSRRATGSSSPRCAAGPPGRFALQAAIAALHAQAPSYAETDWPQIVTLYDALLASGRRRSSRSTGRSRWRWSRAGGGAGRGRGARATAARRLPLPAGDEGRPAAPARPPRRGGRRLPGRARPRRQRGRAGVPASAAGSAQRPGQPVEGRRRAVGPAAERGVGLAATRVVSAATPAPWRCASSEAT